MTPECFVFMEMIIYLKIKVMYLYEIPIHETVDIDDKDDLKLAKKLFRK